MDNHLGTSKFSQSFPTGACSRQNGRHENNGTLSEEKRSKSDCFLQDFEKLRLSSTPKREENSPFVSSSPDFQNLSLKSHSSGDINQSEFIDREQVSIKNNCSDSSFMGSDKNWLLDHSFGKKRPRKEVWESLQHSVDLDTSLKSEKLTEKSFAESEASYFHLGGKKKKPQKAQNVSYMSTDYSVDHSFNSVYEREEREVCETRRHQESPRNISNFDDNIKIKNKLQELNSEGNENTFCDGSTYCGENRSVSKKKKEDTFVFTPEDPAIVKILCQENEKKKKRKHEECKIDSSQKLNGVLYSQEKVKRKKEKKVDQKSLEENLEVQQNPITENSCHVDSLPTKKKKKKHKEKDLEENFNSLICKSSSDDEQRLKQKMKNDKKKGDQRLLEENLEVQQNSFDKDSSPVKKKKKKLTEKDLEENFNSLICNDDDEQRLKQKKKKDKKKVDQRLLEENLEVQQNSFDKDPSPMKKKKKKKRKEQDFQENFHGPDFDDAERLKKKHNQDSLKENLEVPNTENSLYMDPSLMKKKKKKKRKNTDLEDSDFSSIHETKRLKLKKKKKVDQESLKESSQYNLGTQQNSSTEKSVHMDSSPVKKKKKHKETVLEENSDTVKCKSSDFGCIDDAERLELKRKKGKKKKHQILEKNLDSNLEVQQKLNIENCFYMDLSPIKKKKHKESDLDDNFDGVICKSLDFGSIDDKEILKHKKHKEKKTVDLSEKNLESNLGEQQNLDTENIVHMGSPPKKKKKKHKESDLDDNFNGVICKSLDFSSIDDKEILKHKKHKEKKTVEKNLESNLGEHQNLETENIFHMDSPPKKKKKKHKETDLDENNCNGLMSKSSDFDEETLKHTKQKKDKKVDRISTPSPKAKSLKSLHPEAPKKRRLSTSSKNSKMKNLKDIFLEHSSTDVDVCLDDIVTEFKENNDWTQEDLKKLGDLVVICPWPVHPLHMIETRLSNMPTPKQKQEMLDLKVPIKKGHFSKAEDEKIMRNWTEFYQSHNLKSDPQPFLSFVSCGRTTALPPQERVNFVRYLAHDLPDRMLCSVYQRFRKLHVIHRIKRGRFSPKEDQTIIDFLKTSKSKNIYSDLAKLLNRDKYAIERRCSTLANNLEGQEVVKWTTENIQEFATVFVDVLKVNDIRELKTRVVTLDEWKEMEMRLDVPWQKLKDAWFSTIYSKFFAENITSDVVQRRLIEFLIDRGETDWRTLDWNLISEEFSKIIEGFTGKRLLKMLKHLTSYHCPSKIQSDLGACLHLLNENKEQIRGQRIKTLKVFDCRE